MKANNFSNEFDRPRLRLGLLIGGAIFALTLLYGVYAALPFLLGPSVSIRAEIEDSGLTRVFGTTARVSYMSVDGAEIALSEDGSFSVERAYPAGYTWITAEAKDRFGRTITKNLTFVVPQNHAQTQN